MDLTIILNDVFIVALFGNALFFALQAFKIYQGKSAKGVSIISFFGFLFIQAITLLHAYMLHDNLLMYGMAPSMLACMSVIICALYFKYSVHSSADISAEDVPQQLPCMVYWKSIDGRYLGLNKAFETAIGAPAVDILGRTIHDFYPKDVADRITINDHEASRESRLVSYTESGFSKLTNEAKVFSTYKLPLHNARGKVVGVLGLSLEKTELHQDHKERADQLENIMAHLPCHVYWLDANNVYQGCNNVQARSLGLPAREHIVGKSNATLGTIIDPDYLDSNNSKVMQEKSIVVAEEFSRMEDGSTSVMLSHKVPVFNEHNTVIGMVGVSVDISEMKAKQLALEKQVADVQVDNRVKYAFLANMSHDIRTPMSGIISMTEALVAKSGTPSLGKKLVQASNQLMQLLNEIIEVSKMGSERLPVAHKRFHVKDTFAKVVDISVPSAHVKRLKLKLKVDRKIPKELISDETRIHRIILNLVTNAIKFTDHGEINISVMVAKQTPDSCVLQCSVMDTGIGIDPSKHTAIFEKFMRLNMSYDGKYRGLGLGLYIVREFINDLKGEIGVDSELKGAEFTCFIPCKKVLVEDVDTPKKVDFDTVHTHDGAHGLIDQAQQDMVSDPMNVDILRKLAARVLLVDDDKLVQTASQLLLENFGCYVTFASNGEEALSCIQRDKFDLVLMDIGLPGMSGFEVIETIRSALDNANKDLPIIVLTAHMDLTELGEIPATVTDIYNKPMTMELCSRMLSQYLLNKLEHSYAQTDVALAESSA